MEKPPQGSEGNHPMLPWPEAPAAIAIMRDSQAMSARCLEFIALTAVRLAEARAACWSVFDDDKAVWSIPVNRMKTRMKLRLPEPFKVPLSTQALKLLDDLKAHRRSGPFVFPAKIAFRPAAWRCRCKAAA
jgi:integrase